MIACLKGTLIATSLDTAVIDVQGVGYQVLMASKSLARLGMPGDTVRVLTHLQIRDDALVLYGFLNQEEKDLFLRLVSVSSVGPKVALAVLSSIVLELKESFAGEGQPRGSEVFQQALNTKKAVLEALLSMGFTSEEAGLSLKGAPEEASETVLLQYALKRLGK